MDATASDLLDIKGDDQQSEKATGRMGGSIYKLCVWWEVNNHNI